jgi:uncharacterized protein
VDDGLLLLCAVLVLVGIVGVVVPVLPGLALVLGGIAVWTLAERTVLAWSVLALAVVLGAAAQVAKYLVPGRRLTAAGIPRRTLALGALLGVAGFFVIPVVGLLLGFVLGVYLGEHARLGSPRLAWPSTRQAVLAVGLSILIELVAALTAAGVWVAAVLAGR